MKFRIAAAYFHPVAVLSLSGTAYMRAFASTGRLAKGSLAQHLSWREKNMQSRTMSLRMPAAAILVIIGALQSMTIGAHAEIIGLRCVNNSQPMYYTDYTIDLTAGRVSWTTSGVARSHPARITPTTIDWVEDDPPTFGGKTEFHIERSTGFMKAVYYSSNAPKSAEYQCQKTQGF